MVSEKRSFTRRLTIVAFHVLLFSPKILQGANGLVLISMPVIRNSVAKPLMNNYLKLLRPIETSFEQRNFDFTSACSSAPLLALPKRSISIGRHVEHFFCVCLCSRHQHPHCVSFTFSWHCICFTILICSTNAEL